MTDLRRGDAWPHTSKASEAAAAAADRALLSGILTTIKTMINVFGHGGAGGGNDRINARFNALEADTESLRARVDALERPRDEVPAAVVFAEMERMVGELEKLAEKIRPAASPA